MTYLLDINATGEDGEDIGDSIAASLKVVGCPEAFKIASLSTDNGGAGTTDEGMAKLIARGLTILNALVAGCTIHGLCLQLSEGIIKWFGQGGLDTSNMMQMLHSAYDVQKHFTTEEWHHTITVSAEWVKERLSDDYEIDEEDHFEKKFAVVKTWRKWKPMEDAPSLWPQIKDKDGELKSSYRGIPPAILTRWKYVGDAACVVWHSYIVLFRLLQVVINVHGSRVMGGIASKMMPLMTNVEIYSDLAFTKCFHEGYFNRNIDWMMQSDDLTKPGWQSHQILVRYYWMDRRLTKLKHSMFTYAPDFDDFQKTLRLDGIDREMQKKKATAMMDGAIKQLHRHFIRWATQELIPAALLAEPPLAKAVARTILGLEADPLADAPFADNMGQTFYSKAHDDFFKISAFEQFVGKQFKKTLSLDALAESVYDPTKLFKPIVLFAAKNLLMPKPLCDLRDVKKLNIRYGSPLLIQKHMWSFYLPMASHTQPVESALKLGRDVSKSGRHEETRSAVAILKHNLILDPEDRRKRISELSASDKAFHYFKSTQLHYDTVEGLLEKDGTGELLAEIKEAGKRKHFKHKRIEKKIEKIDETGNKLRKENKHQKSTALHRTAAALGMTPYSIFSSDGPSGVFLRLELIARGFTVDELKDQETFANFSAVLNALKAHEMDRVRYLHLKSDEIDRGEAVLLAKKNFVQLQDGDKFEPQEKVSVKPTDRMVLYSQVKGLSIKFLRDELIARDFPAEEIATMGIKCLKVELTVDEVDRIGKVYKDASEPTKKAHQDLAKKYFLQLQEGPLFVAPLVVKPTDRMVLYSKVGGDSIKFVRDELLARAFTVEAVGNKGIKRLKKDLMAHEVDRIGSVYKDANELTKSAHQELAKKYFVQLQEGALFVAPVKKKKKKKTGAEDTVTDPMEGVVVEARA